MPLRYLILLLLSTPALAQMTETRYLSGTDKDHRLDWDFRIDRGRNSGEWGKIAVPSNWEFEGYGVFAYGQANGPDRPGWHELLPEVDATAVYRTTFTVPADWSDRYISIVFEGVMTDASVRINGQSAGPTHQGGFYEFSYPVTELLRQGQNELEVTVNNVSRNASVNRAERDADFWVHSGIHRPVYLEAKPRRHIRRIATDARADGTLTVHLFPQGIQSSSLRARSQVQRLDGTPVGPPITASLADSDRPDRAHRSDPRGRALVTGIPQFVPTRGIHRRRNRHHPTRDDGAHRLSHLRAAPPRWFLPEWTEDPVPRGEPSYRLAYLRPHDQ